MTQYLEEKEYQQIKRDMHTMLKPVDIALKKAEGVDFDYYGSDINVTLGGIEAKLTAYVDQILKRLSDKLATPCICEECCDE